MLDNVVVEAGDHRVIICKGGIQWIMQRRKKMRSGDVWVSTRYHFDPKEPPAAVDRLLRAGRGKCDRGIT